VVDIKFKTRKTKPYILAFGAKHGYKEKNKYL
jgi:hypothetical protein